MIIPTDVAMIYSVDLSVAFDHNNSYSLTGKSLKLISSFANGRKFWTKMCFSHSLYLNLLVGLPQGSILGSLLFNIIMYNLSFFLFPFFIVNLTS